MLAVALPMRIYDGLPDELMDGREMWHDYLSVPQWQEAVKQQILVHVASIFRQASFTLVHLEDVSRQCIQQMRSGRSLRERAEGVARICNAAWFSRVWTAMEYVRSRDIRPMLDDCTLFEGVHDLFLAELHDSWDSIVKARGDVHEAEKLARDGLVPWQLGPLARIRSQETSSFAEAFSVLAKRGCRSNKDFFHALDGILGTNWEPGPNFNYRNACLRFARDCLRRGDYTPLLMSRLPVDDNPGGIGIGYHDMGMWSLGTLKCSPTDSLSLSPGGNPVLKVEKIGPVQFIKKLDFRGLHPEALFSHIARVALDFTGPNVEDFVATVGTRLYGQNTAGIQERLSEDDRRQLLGRKLVERFNFQGGQEPWKRALVAWLKRWKYNWTLSQSGRSTSIGQMDHEDQ
ncbi:hypothetical protein SLS56_000852 [Neofusicoccum ribis]|uniref:Heterokaryon incompatibility domain-containing protein n=1 Tax=Neofusicoccum ribis TaxID=45134 RepID=A0ABR3TCC8_9PEZI